MSFEALNKYHPGWHMTPPVSISRPFAFTEQMDFATSTATPFAGEETKLCVYQALPIEYVVIHQMALRASIKVDRGYGDVYEELDPVAILGKLSWSLKITNNSNSLLQRHGTVDPELRTEGFAMLQNFSVQDGNLQPVIAAPGSEIYLSVVGVDHTVGITIPLESYIWGSLSGYRVMHKSVDKPIRGRDAQK